MIVISGIIRLIQELRAKSTAEQLDRLIHEKVTVRRNGELREIPDEELVVGDLILFSAGDRVPADIRLTKVTDLFISQAAITGESAILEKSCRTLCYKEQEPINTIGKSCVYGNHSYQRKRRRHCAGCRNGYAVRRIYQAGFRR